VAPEYLSDAASGIQKNHPPQYSSAIAAEENEEETIGLAMCKAKTSCCTGPRTARNQQQTLPTKTQEAAQLSGQYTHTDPNVCN
jgi:hypothetical protein